jgi:hypothetical protein
LCECRSTRGEGVPGADASEQSRPDSRGPVSVMTTIRVSRRRR